MLAVVQDAEEFACSQRGNQRFDWGEAGPRREAERADDRFWHEGWIGQAGEFHQPDAVLIVRYELTGYFEREPRLADAARPRKRDSARFRQQSLHLVDLRPAADETR
jgi:hypothetical protein